jgi:hypothetical protein
MWAGALGLLVLAGVGAIGPVIAGLYLMVRLNRRAEPWT